MDGSNILRTSVLPLVTDLNAFITRGILDGYQAATRPFVADPADPEGSSAVPIEVQFQLQNLKVINDHVYFKGYLRLYWHDTRLKYDQLVPDSAKALPSYANVFLGNSSAIWTPDVFFDKVLFAPDSPTEPHSRTDTCCRTTPFYMAPLSRHWGRPSRPSPAS